MNTWLGNLSIKKKLFYSFSLMIIFLVIVAAIGVYNLQIMNGNIVSYSEVHLPSTNFLLQLDRDLHQAVVAQRTMVFTEVGTEKFTQLKKDNDENIKQAIERWEKFKAVQGELADAALIKKHEEEREKWIQVSNRIVSLLEQNTPESKTQAISLMSGEGSTTFEAAREEINLLTEIGEKQALEVKDESQSAYSSATLFIILVFLFVALFATWVAYSMIKMISRPVIEATDLMKELSKGHLGDRVTVHSTDEIGVLSGTMNSFADTLQGVVKEMHKIANGKFDTKIKELDAGDEIAPGLNKIIDTLNNLKQETKNLTEAAVNGNLSKRGNTEKFEGDYKDIIKGINSTLDEMLHPIQEGAKVLQVIATGDLTARVTGDYKGDHQLIKNSINNVASSLNETLMQVSEAIQATASASAQISSSTEEMASGASEQSSQTTEVASAVEEMTKTILETTNNASLASDSAKRAGIFAKEGDKVVTETIEGMNRIAKVVNKSSETVHTLGVSSNQIGEIVQVINDIADQTNLLALNAAIEAARAGEQGRGFAVVADEVRKLAEKTTKATKEIAEMIKQIQRDTEDAVISMKEGTSEVENGRRLADKAGESLKAIIKGTVEVVDISTQVAAASEEQSSAAELISKSIEAINSVSQESSSGLQQIARAAEDLNRLTNSLQDMITRFKVESSSMRYLGR